MDLSALSAAVIKGDVDEVTRLTKSALEERIEIQEIINLMNTSDGTYHPMLQAMHIHPALSEIVQRTFGRLAPIDGGHQHNH